MLNYFTESKDEYPVPLHCYVLHRMDTAFIKLLTIY